MASVTFRPAVNFWLYAGVLEGYCWHWDFICKEEVSIHLISTVIVSLYATCLSEHFLNFNRHMLFSEKMILCMYISLLLYLSIWRWAHLYSPDRVEWEECYPSGSPGTPLFAVALWLDIAHCVWGRWDPRKPVVPCRVPEQFLCSVPALHCANHQGVGVRIPSSAHLSSQPYAEKPSHVPGC